MKLINPRFVTPRFKTSGAIARHGSQSPVLRRQIHGPLRPMDEPKPRWRFW